MFVEGTDKLTLHEDNARDIYKSLSHLKRWSTENCSDDESGPGNFTKSLPGKICMQAQYSAPPLSLPLITKTFQILLGKGTVRPI